MIVADYLRRTQTLYGLQVLPALLDEDDHAAWAALDVILRTIAAWFRITGSSLSCTSITSKTALCATVCILFSCNVD